MPNDGLFSAHYLNEASMVSDIYIIYIPPNILMNTEFFFVVVVVVVISTKGASTHHLRRSPNNTTLVSNPVCTRDKPPAANHLAAINSSPRQTAGPWWAAHASVATAAPNFRMRKQSRAAKDSQCKSTVPMSVQRS